MTPSEGVTLLMFVGREVHSDVEEMLARANQAVALDTIDRALSLDECERIVVATNSAEFAARLAELPVTVEVDEGNFHFGRRLAELIGRHCTRKPFYGGGGSMPLLDKGAFASICRDLSAFESVVIPNNLYSSDFVAFSPGEAIGRIAPPDTDNDLAFRLHRGAGLRNIPLPRTAATQMDVDTPTDLTILQLHPRIGKHTATFLRSLDLDVGPLRAVLQRMNDPTAELVVLGRIGAHAMVQIEKNIACRTRVLSEEKGMRASGRDQRGEVRSLAGLYLEAVGIPRFFEALPELGQAALIDTRVIFEHFRFEVSAQDRYYSDLMDVDRIQHPFVRELTRAAKSASIPVVLGGHSLVAGGLLALVEAAALTASPAVQQSMSGT
ncbi:MAG: hypothetical protein HY675_18755 [Chloroflexi bacterium]|nr:hypothetical protein [Chloroflexota bacterium]